MIGMRNATVHQREKTGGFSFPMSVDKERKERKGPLHALQSLSFGYMLTYKKNTKKDECRQRKERFPALRSLHCGIAAAGK